MFAKRTMMSHVSARPSPGVSPRPVSCRRSQVVAAALNSSESLRRTVLLGGAAMLASGLAQPVVALADEANASGAYSDVADKFELTPPKGWAFGEGEIGGATGFTGATGQRRTLAWFPTDANARDVNITVVITNVSVEFTKLGSFGNVDTFAGNLINSLDRSYLLKKGAWGRPPASNEPVQIAKLVDYKNRKGGDQYEIEYTVEKLPEPKRHLLSLVQLGSNGTYNRLYTVTAQCLEGDLAKYRPELEAAIASFKADVKTLI